MARSIHKSFIAGVAAVAVAITAMGTAPVQAGDRRTEQALAALLGLAVVGAIIADRRDKDRAPQVVTRNPTHHGAGPGPGRHGVTPRPLPQRAQRHVLPQQCLQVVRAHRGPAHEVLDSRCLQRNYSFVRNLPRQCLESVRGGRGGHRETVWNAHCLERNGYRISRR